MYNNLEIVHRYGSFIAVFWYKHQLYRVPAILCCNYFFSAKQEFSARAVFEKNNVYVKALTLRHLEFHIMYSRQQ